MNFKFTTELLVHMEYCDPGDNYEKFKSTRSFISTESKMKHANIKNIMCTFTHECDICDKGFNCEGDLKRHKTLTGHYKSQGYI